MTLQGYNLTGKEYLYFFDLTKCIGYDTVFEGCPTPQVPEVSQKFTKTANESNLLEVCVEACPDYYQASAALSNSRVLSAASKNFAEELKKVICVDEKTKVRKRNS